MLKERKVRVPTNVNRQIAIIETLIHSLADTTTFADSETNALLELVLTEIRDLRIRTLPTREGAKKSLNVFGRKKPIRKVLPQRMWHIQQKEKLIESLWEIFHDGTRYKRIIFEKNGTWRFSKQGLKLSKGAEKKRILGRQPTVSIKKIISIRNKGEAKEEFSNRVNHFFTTLEDKVNERAITLQKLYESFKSGKENILPQELFEQPNAERKIKMGFIEGSEKNVREK